MSVLPDASVAVQVTVVEPNWNPCDGASFVIIGDGSAISVAVAVPRSERLPFFPDRFSCRLFRRFSVG